jgi:hypothetical protein
MQPSSCVGGTHREEPMQVHKGEIRTTLMATLILVTAALLVTGLLGF